MRQKQAPQAQRHAKGLKISEGNKDLPSCPRVVAKVDAGLKAKKPTSSRKVPQPLDVNCSCPPESFGAYCAEDFRQGV